VKTCVRYDRAELFSLLSSLLPTAVASAVGLQTDEIETKFLHANSILEFSHSLGQQETSARSSYISPISVIDLRAASGT
jgi:hypothetical protein